MSLLLVLSELAHHGHLVVLHGLVRLARAGLSECLTILVGLRSLSLVLLQQLSLVGEQGVPFLVHE